jgi:hypothetical protein
MPLSLFKEVVVCFNLFSNVLWIVLKVIMQHLSDCDGNTIFGISSKQIAIWTKSYQNRTQFDLFRTKWKLSHSWMGVRSLPSLGCSQIILLLLLCYTILYYTILYKFHWRTSAMSQSVAEFIPSTVVLPSSTTSTTTIFDNTTCISNYLPPLVPGYGKRAGGSCGIGMCISMRKHSGKAATWLKIIIMSMRQIDIYSDTRLTHGLLQVCGAVLRAAASN